MIVFDEARLPYVSPKGARLRFTIRLATSDHNTVFSAANENEYGLRERNFSGVAFDIGAHIGAVAVPLAVDNPELSVVAVEPVPDNARLLWMNARDNGVGERVHIVKGAAGPPGVSTTRLHSMFRGSETALHHAFIGATEVGNSEIADAWRLGTDHDIEDVPAFDLTALVEMYGIPSFIKIDCEGAEYGILTDPVVETVPLIIGEWHPVPYGGRKTSRREDLADLLPRHSVTFSGPEEGPGGFVAVL